MVLRDPYKRKITKTLLDLLIILTLFRSIPVKPCDAQPDILGPPVLVTEQQIQDLGGQRLRKPRTCLQDFL